jgi:DNA-binding transcriptional MerR regulator
MAGGEFLTIGELARAAGLTAKTVRFWSDQGLLPPAGRTPAGYRLYGPGALARLGLIRALRDLGVGLTGVRTVLDREITIGEIAAVHAAALEVQVRALRLQLESGGDRRYERYWQLLAIINGWPAQPAVMPAAEWLAEALRRR